MGCKGSTLLLVHADSRNTIATWSHVGHSDVFAHQPFHRCQQMRLDTVTGSKQGYDVDMLKERALSKDRRPHPILGEVFRVVTQEDGVFGKKQVKTSDSNQGDFRADPPAAPTPALEEGRSRLLALADKDSRSSSSSSSSSSNKKKSKKDKKSKKAKKDKKKSKKEQKDKKAHKRGLDENKECMKPQTCGHHCTPLLSWRLCRPFFGSGLQRQRRSHQQLSRYYSQLIRLLGFCLGRSTL